MTNTAQAVHFAFVDESGDPNLNTEVAGVSALYVVAAVLVERTQRDALAVKVDEVRSRFFGTGEMKSSGVGNNTQRRRELLAALVATEMKFCAVVADKSQIDTTSGLQYKQSFIKYLHGRLYRRLYKAFSSLHILADEHGRSEFMDGFQNYLRQRYQNELFDHHDFSFVPSEKHALVQAADVVAGSLQRIYSAKDPKDLLEVLSPAAIIVERWPPTGEMTDLTSGLADSERYDHLVAQQSVMLAKGFVSEYSDTDDADRESQVEALRYLLYRYELDPTAYIHAQPILDHVNTCREEQMSLQSLRMNVIAQLRSHGVIIASSNKGYKIPNTSADVDEFVSLVEGQTLPYLKRLSQARTHLLTASCGRYDIVSASRFGVLLRCLKEIEKASIMDLLDKIAPDDIVDADGQ